MFSPTPKCSPEYSNAKVNRLQQVCVPPPFKRFSLSYFEVYAYSMGKPKEVGSVNSSPFKLLAEGWPWVDAYLSIPNTHGRVLKPVPHGFSGDPQSNGAPVPTAVISSLTHALWVFLSSLTSHHFSVLLASIISQTNYVYWASASHCIQGSQAKIILKYLWQNQSNRCTPWDCLDSTGGI